MTDINKVIKGYEVCHIFMKEPCESCPYFKEDLCSKNLSNDVYAVLQQAKDGKQNE